jgi:hypothetical protein
MRRRAALRAPGGGGNAVGLVVATLASARWLWRDLKVARCFA